MEPKTQLQGRWIAVFGEYEGNAETDPEVMSQFEFVFAGTQFQSVSPGQIRKGDFHVDAAREPMGLVFNFDDGRIAEGIFKFDGEQLCLCMAAPEEPQPKEFTAPDGTGHLLTIFQRHATNE